MIDCLLINIGCSSFAYIATRIILPRCITTFLDVNIKGKDLNKINQPVIPEAGGFISGFVYLVSLITFLMLIFLNGVFIDKVPLSERELEEFLAALVSISWMHSLGFADDVLNLKWRYKLIFPPLSALPLLIIYYIHIGLTTVVMPKFLRGFVGPNLDLGIFYYVYMGMLAVFCTNAINIYAGVNGLEVGQSVIIACSICIFNAVELSGELSRYHRFSLYFMLPYIATSLGLLKLNWYPAKFFVGDTFCYFSGVTFAVVGILGHFSKTLLLFFLPQVFNFLLSVPQLFRLVPCPRHRLPTLNKETGLLETSKVKCKVASLGPLGRPVLLIASKLRLVSLVEKDDSVVEFSNMTLINAVLNILGPMREDKLCKTLLLIQVIGTAVAFVIRYPLASFFY
ncbi:UDP-N-acetylglucosamine--dolichyl-phosphate N-acetylglucosaminephosphotransferase-like isoform X1 [Artemia franciscana]|uniref:UDP-N-acetylglucosamine--dolichyl-phosphate N-acetylglucosaminephosphotransferase-like isoform X1 n=1 Tax=Artemia franciscana TaxID=6661 RepID=UPI0032DA9A73